MKILLDENIPAKAKIEFGSDNEIHTVRDMGWHGKKNGELLKLITENSFDFFITLDKNLRHQQNLALHDVNIFLLLPYNNKHQTLIPFLQAVKERLKEGMYKKFNEITL